MRVDSTPSGDEDMEGCIIGICLNEAGGALATMKGICNLFGEEFWLAFLFYLKSFHFPKIRKHKSIQSKGF